MAIDRSVVYPGRFSAATPTDPQGAFENETAPGANDKSYLDETWANDLSGLIARLLTNAGVVLNGLVDNGLAAQSFDALIFTIQEQIDALSVLTSALVNDDESTSQILAPTANALREVSEASVKIADLVDDATSTSTILAPTANALKDVSESAVLIADLVNNANSSSVLRAPTANALREVSQKATPFAAATFNSSGNVIGASINIASSSLVSTGVYQITFTNAFTSLNNMNLSSQIRLTNTTSSVLSTTYNPTSTSGARIYLSSINGGSANPIALPFSFSGIDTGL